MSQQAIEKPARFMSLRWKLLIGFTLVFAVTFAGAYYWFYQFTTETALQHIQEDLVGTMRAAAQGVDGDQLESLFATSVPRADGYTDDPRYWEQVKWLATAHTIEPRAMLYTYKLGSQPNELIFVTSNGAVLNPPFGAKFRESWITDYPDANQRGLITTTLQTIGRGGCTYGAGGCKLEPYKDDFGAWVSGFTPITNRKGEVVAALGVDFQADYVYSVQSEILKGTVIAFVVTYSVLFVLLLVTSRVLTQPLMVLSAAAQAIGDGQYEEGLKQMEKTSASTLFADETTLLSRVLESTTQKVYQREQMLRKQVEELRIEIDDTKRQREVGEIVDTEFFRDLQAKARTMRSRQMNRQVTIALIGEDPTDGAEHLPDEPDLPTHEEESGARS